jgi:Ulp1 family protease
MTSHQFDKMARYACPLLDQIFTCWESFQESDCTFNDLTTSKIHLLQSEFPLLRPPAVITVDMSDLSCLYGRDWINDEVLNSYISLVVSESDLNVGCTNSFFYNKLVRDGCETAASWQGIKNQPIDRYSMFMIPICCGVHWILAVFDFIGGQLAILDSLGGEHPEVAKRLGDFFVSQGGGTMPVVHPEVPMQCNGDDCGVFVMEFAHCICTGQPLNSFEQTDIPRFRTDIRARLQAVMKR